MKKKFMLFFIVFLLAPLIASAQAELPRPTAYVSDYAGILDNNTKTQIESRLIALKDTTGCEVAVVTVPTIGENTIEDYAVKLFERWGIGEKQKDNGLLLLVAVKEHKIRFEVGYGLEPIINDAMAGRIIREFIAPKFKDGNYALGLVSGVDTISNVITSSGEFVSDGKLPKEGRFSKAIRLIGKILFAIFMIYLFIRHPWLFLLLLSSSGGGGSRGGFGGSFGGFGGGRSGGGGASGSW